MTAAVRPISKPLTFTVKPKPERTGWWCSDCGTRVAGPWHTCEEGE